MVARVSIGKLFAGGIVPGFILVGAFMAYIAICSFSQSHYPPALPKEKRVPVRELIRLVKGLILPIRVITMVLGTIFAGIASPTEAAAVGVAGALISAVMNRKLIWSMLSDAAVRSMAISGMVMWILFGATCFTSIFFRTGGQDLIADLLLGMNTNPIFIFAFILATLIVLGFFLDEITQVQMDYLTPPFGFTLFYLKGVAPPEVSMGDIYRSILPFVLIQLAVVIFILVYPEVVLWLPNLLF